MTRSCADRSVQQERRRYDRVTLGLAAAAVATAGTVLAGEFVRLTRRRAGRRNRPTGPLDTAEYALATAGVATQDAVNVAVEGYGAASRRETVLFNILSGFVGGFAFMRLSTAGMRGGWWPPRNVSVGGRHIHHFVPGILVAFAAGGAGW